MGAGPDRDAGPVNHGRNVMGMRPFHIEGDDRPLLPGPAEDLERIDLGKPRHSIVAQIGLVRRNGIKADRFHVVERRA